MNHKIISSRQRAMAKSMRSQMTEAELKLWNELRAHRLMGLGFRRQVPVGNYIVDFACAEHRLVIEVDGSGHARNIQMKQDQKRTRFLQQQGWDILRFWNDDVIRDIDGTCSHIIAFLGNKGVNFE